MTGRELYEAQREVAAGGFGVALPPWEELSAFRRWMWDETAAEYVKKGLLDREDEDGS